MANEWLRLAAEFDERAEAWRTAAGTWASDADERGCRAGERVQWAAQRTHDLAAWIRQAARDLLEPT
jgi:hypothetical protein